MTVLVIVLLVLAVVTGLLGAFIHGLLWLLFFTLIFFCVAFVLVRREFVARR